MQLFRVGVNVVRKICPAMSHFTVFSISIKLFGFRKLLNICTFIKKFELFNYLISSDIH